MIYFQMDSTKVLARFDLKKTWNHFLIFFGVPSVLFVISFISLCIITRSVKVGDDAKMRCKYCTDETSDIDDIDELANKCVQQLNAIQESVNEHEHMDQPSTSKVIAVSFLLFFRFSVCFFWSILKICPPIFFFPSHTICHRHHRLMNRKQRPAKQHMKNKTHQEQLRRQLT